MNNDSKEENKKQQPIQSERLVYVSLVFAVRHSTQIKLLMISFSTSFASTLKIFNVNSFVVFFSHSLSFYWFEFCYKSTAVLAIDCAYVFLCARVYAEGVHIFY